MPPGIAGVDVADDGVDVVVDRGDVESGEGPLGEVGLPRPLQRVRVVAEGVGATVLEGETLSVNRQDGAFGVCPNFGSGPLSVVGLVIRGEFGGGVGRSQLGRAFGA